MEYPYKGYIIKPASFQLQDSGKWTLRIYIQRNTEDETVERPYWVDKILFSTKEEAIQRSIEFGQRIIDGNVPGLSVADL